MEKRIINFDTEMVGSGGEIVLPDLPQEHKDKLVAQAIETASYVLLFTMKCVKVENFITGTIDNKGITYELSFKKSQPSEQKPPEENFYCADWYRCGTTCEEQCPACKKTNNLEDVSEGIEDFFNKRAVGEFSIIRIMQEFAQQSMKQERERLEKILRTPEPWPLENILSKLIEASNILLQYHSYDGQGYEEIQGCVGRAKEIISELEKLKK